MTKKERTKLRRQRKIRRTVTTIALMALTAVLAIGGTIAWLTDKTEPVENTFTAGDINITLTETWNTGSDEDGQKDSWSAQLIPGTSYLKDPVVTVEEGSEDCYLFVKFTESGDPSTYLTYTSTLTEANGWKLVEGKTNIWYREVKNVDTTRQWHLLAGDSITVKAEAVTKDTMDSAKLAKLEYQAYAIQTANTGTVAEAWAKIGA